MTVDGVEVTENSQSIPPFEKNRNYLLFISFVPGGVARLAGGPASIFTVCDDGKLDGVDVNKHKIKSRFGGRLSTLKSHINVVARQLNREPVIIQ